MVISGHRYLLETVVPGKISAVVPGKIIGMVNKNVAVKKVKKSKKKQLEKQADIEEFKKIRHEVWEWELRRAVEKQEGATVELRRAVDEQFSMAMRSLPRSKSTSVCTPNPIVIRNLQAWSRRPQCIHQQACVIRPIFKNACAFIQVSAIGAHLQSVGAHLQENRQGVHWRSLSVSPCRKKGLVKQSLVKQLLKL